MTDTIEQPVFTDEDAVALAKLQSVQKANVGRMKSTRKAVESTEAKIVALLDKRWSTEPKYDFIEENDYPAFKALMQIHGSDAAHKYRHDYILSIDPQFNYELVDATTSMPIIRLEVEHDLPNDDLVGLGEALVKWTRWRGQHEHEVSDDDDDFTEAMDTASVEFSVLTHDHARFGKHWLRVYGDATAQRVEKVGTTSLSLDTERRPLYDVLTEVREHWYYPASSNAGHVESVNMFGWNDHGEDEDYDLPETDFLGPEESGAVQPS